MPPQTSIDFTIAVAALAQYRRDLKAQMLYYQQQPETAITVTDPRHIVEELYVVDQAYKKLLFEANRLN